MDVETLNGWSAAWAERMEIALWQGTLLILAAWVVCRLFPRLPAVYRRLLWWMVLLKPLLCLVPATLPVPGVTVSLAREVSTSTKFAGTMISTWEAQRVHSSEAKFAVKAAHTDGKNPAPVSDDPRGFEHPLSPFVSVPRLPLKSAGSSPVSDPLLTTDRFQPHGTTFYHLNLPFSPHPTPATLLMILWFGLVAAWIPQWLYQVRIARRLRTGSRLVTDATILREAVQLGDAMGLSAVPIVRESPEAACPLVLGATGATLLIPSEDLVRFSPSRIRMALAHELGHVRRRDLWMSWAPELSRALFSYHPLIWFAHEEWAAAVETACDADAVRWAGVSIQEYGHFLLDLSTRKTSAQAGWGTWFAFRQIDLRLAALSRTRHGAAHSWRMGGGTLLASLAVMTLPWSLPRPELGSPIPSSFQESTRTAGNRPSVTVNRKPILPSKHTASVTSGLKQAVTSKTASSPTFSSLDTAKSLTQADPFDLGLFQSLSASEKPSNLPSQGTARKITQPGRSRVKMFTASPPITHPTPIVPDMPTARAGLQVVMGADGRIYAIGGSGNPGSPNPDYNIIEAYNPYTNMWDKSIPSIPVSSEGLAAANGTVDGIEDSRIFIFGGTNNDISEGFSDATLNYGWMIIPNNLKGGIKRKTDLPTPLQGLTAVTGADGMVYLFGGKDGDTRESNVYQYNPNTDSYQTKCPMPIARDGFGAALGQDRKIYIFGGNTNLKSRYINEVDVYDTDRNSWSISTPMPCPREGLSAVTGRDGRIYVMGGQDQSGDTHRVDIWDTNKKVWVEGQPLHLKRDEFGAALGPDGYIYVMGGRSQDRSALSSVEAYSTLPQKSRGVSDLQYIQTSTTPKSGRLIHQEQFRNDNL